MERVTLLIRNEWLHVIGHRIPLITEFAKMRGLPHRCNLLQTDISAHTARKKMRVETPVEMRVKTPDLILGVLAVEPTLTLKQVAELIGKSTSTVERATSALVKEGRLRFVGPRKGGHWEVLPVGGETVTQ